MEFRGCRQEDVLLEVGVVFQRGCIYYSVGSDIRVGKDSIEVLWALLGNDRIGRI